MRQDREKRGKNLLSLGLREMRKGKYFLVKLFFSISSFIEFSPFSQQPNWGFVELLNLFYHICQFQSVNNIIIYL